MNERYNKALGVLFGTAIGDAWAAPTEFMQVREIEKVYGLFGPGAPSSRVTDDTQMALAVAKALLSCSRPYDPQEVAQALTREFIVWYNDPENNRAPGGGCLAACAKLKKNVQWQCATGHTQKGCGANMRVMPVGLLSVDDMTRSAIAQLQAALTHAHPTALAASDITSYAIAYLASGKSPKKLLEALIAYTYTMENVYHQEWLGCLWKTCRFFPQYRLASTSPYWKSAEEYISYGWTEVRKALLSVQAHLHHKRARDWNIDPCTLTGEGWIAEEAFATALLVYLAYRNEGAVLLFRRAATTCGDSDSIAAIAGAFYGAEKGVSALKGKWVSTSEYYDDLEISARRLAHR